jgi:hypothetical protein
MKRLSFLPILIAITLLTPAVYSQPVRLSTVQPVITAIANVQNYAVILIEGALPETWKIDMVEGPGQVALDEVSKRWLWSWQPAAADVGRSYAVTLKDMSGQKCLFQVQVRTLTEDWMINNLKQGKFYSGIPSTIRMKQPGLDGAYRMRLYLDDELVADSTEPTLAIKPALHEAVGKQARLDVEYTAPLTNKPTLLATYTAKVKYPPFRTPPTQEIASGEPILFKAAMGIPPNFYTTVPGRILVAKSDGYFQDTAYMISGLVTTGDDPFGMFSRNVKIGAGTGKYLAFDFGLKPTDKVNTITEKSGRVVFLSLLDPITKQTGEIEVRIYPNLIRSEE